MANSFVIISNPNGDAELLHYGVLGMKWGIRRYQNPDGTLTAAGKRRYEKGQLKEAKKQYKQTVREASRGAGLGIGIKGIEKAKAAESAINQAEQDLIRAKAQYARNTKGEKAELKAYAKEMHKSGLAGSITDDENRGRSTRIYDQLVKEKGKEYADKVTKSVQNRLYGEFAVATAAVGATFVISILDNLK